MAATARKRQRPRAREKNTKPKAATAEATIRANGVVPNKEGIGIDA